MVAKRTQHVAPNNIAICCVDMLRSFFSLRQDVDRGFAAHNRSFSTEKKFLWALAPKVVLHERRVGINKQSSEISQRCC